MDISSNAEFYFGENVWINESNNLTMKRNAKFSIGKNTYITRATISILNEVTIGGKLYIR